MKRGVLRVRPLAGGIDGWRERGYPVVPASSPRPVFPARSEAADQLE